MRPKEKASKIARACKEAWDELNYGVKGLLEVCHTNPREKEIIAGWAKEEGVSESHIRKLIRLERK